VRASRWRRPTLVALLLACLGLAACARGATGPRPLAPPSHRAAPLLAPPPGPRGVPDFRHVFLLVMENLNAATAEHLPYIRGLARRFAVATRYFAVAHPSLPNYLALTSGHTWVRSDCWFCVVRAPNLAASLAAAGIGWGAYMQGLPRPCWLGPFWPLGLYAGKHDPFRYYEDVRDSPALCAHIRPLSTLTAALPGPPGAVPRFVWITPNLCADGHSCPVALADRWLAGFVPRILASAAWREGGVLFITWDEAAQGTSGCCGAGGPGGGGGGRVLTLVIAPGLPPGLQVAVPYNHYSLLRTIEQAWGLPLLGASALPAVRAMTAFWERP
jgi:hypothetical protein